MKIRRIAAYRVELPLHEGSYKWSGGKSVSVFDSTVVRVDTDEGVTGYGEVCPLGPFYLPAYAGGVRAGLVELGPHLLGEQFSAADVMMGFTLLAARVLGVLDDRFPALNAYMARLEARPAFQKALAVG